jgi:hypothetical protein
MYSSKWSCQRSFCLAISRSREIHSGSAGLRVGARSQSLHTQRATATICPAEALAKEEAFRVVGAS